MTQSYAKLAPFNPAKTPPDELYLRRAWIGWRAVLKQGQDKPDKVPVAIKTGLGDGYLLPENHVSYDEAVQAVGRLHLSGVGFVLTKGCGLVGGDMDKCRDALTGVIEPWAQAIIDLNETYLEVSPSGTGIRFWALEDAIILRTIKSAPAGVEIYPWGRYLTFTGDQILGSPSEILSATRTLQALMDRVHSFKATTSPSGPAGQAGAPGAAPDLDALLLRKAYQATPMGQINEAALANLDKWVPELFPTAEHQPGTGAWRVKSADLGRGLEEDLSISPGGIVDFGVHDLGDPREGKRTAIDVVMEWSDAVPKMDATDAAAWLGDRVGVPFGPGSGSSPGPDPDAKIVDAWLAALARLRAASPHPAFAAGGSVDLPDGTQAFDPSYAGPAALRPGITDRLTRGFVSSVSSAANAGKSTYLGVEAAAIACERSDLLGLPTPMDWCGDGLIVSNEESANTLTSRWRGLMRSWGLTAADFKHKLRIWPTREKLRIGRGGRDKSVTPTRAGVDFVNRLAEWAEAGNPIVFIGLDTLISIFEGVDENSSEMDKAIGLLIQIAEAGFIAVDVMQHQGKAGSKEDIQAYRGSSAIFAALAEMSTLTALTEAEGKDYNLSAVQARNTLRLMGQRQRDGALPGTWCFVREIVTLAAQDPRNTGIMATKTVAILKPVVLSLAGSAAGDADEAWRVLWSEQRLGREVRRGGASGSRHRDHAAVILAGALGWSPNRAGRAVDELGGLGGWSLRKGRDKNKNPVDFIDVKEPPSRLEHPF